MGIFARPRYDKVPTLRDMMFSLLLHLRMLVGTILPVKQANSCRSRHCLPGGAAGGRDVGGLL